MRSGLIALPLLALLSSCSPQGVSDEAAPQTASLEPSERVSGLTHTLLQEMPLAHPDDGLTGGDVDQDGIDDEVEEQLAVEYLPFRSLSPKESCPESGIVFRLSPHPDNPAYLHIIYDVLYDNDCGEGGHPGDDEVFAITVDPSKPAPQGIVAMIGIAHQGTLCNSKTECQTCGNDGDKCTMIDYQGASWPVAFASRNKHGNYMFDGKLGRYRCDYNCFFADHCDLALFPTRVPMLNVGEPGHPLTRDLTDAGLVTPENGFQEQELYHYDPWGTADFGGAGVVSKDLTDSAFNTKIPYCN